VLVVQKNNKIKNTQTMKIKKLKKKIIKIKENINDLF
jgi:hypothetical protein